MATSITPVATQTRAEDVLSHLPVASTTDYAQGQIIYGPEHVSRSLYLVITGKVLISRVGEEGSEVVLEIVRPEELFGESAFFAVSHRSEQATALEKVTVMAWPITDMEDMMMKRPRLALALLQVLAQRNAEFSRRIESLSLESIERRLARSLLRFSERLGKPEEDGSVKLMPLTHDLLSRYVGTSREIITQYMNRFRKQGYVSYSRNGIVLNGDVLKTVLDKFEPAAATPSN
jgi:CRP/FNR family transcriptional regulator, cyclic AMP receptor protein